MKGNITKENLQDFLDLKLDTFDLIKINGDPDVTNTFDIENAPIVECSPNQLIFMIDSYLEGKIDLDRVQRWVDNVWWNDNLFSWTPMTEEQEEYFIDILSFIDGSDSDFFGFSDEKLRQKRNELAIVFADVLGND